MCVSSAVLCLHLVYCPRSAVLCACVVKVFKNASRGFSMHRTHTWKLLDLHKSKPGNRTYAHVRTCVWMGHFRTYWIFS